MICSIYKLALIKADFSLFDIVCLSNGSKSKLGCLGGFFYRTCGKYAGTDIRDVGKTQPVTASTFPGTSTSAPAAKMVPPFPFQCEPELS